MSDSLRERMDAMPGERVDLDFDYAEWANQFQLGFSVAFSIILDAMRYEYVALEAQRDELLAVCELLLEWNTSESLVLSDIMRQAKAAIANVKGE